VKKYLHLMDKINRNEAIVQFHAICNHILDELPSIKATKLFDFSRLTNSFYKSNKVPNNHFYLYSNVSFKIIKEYDTLEEILIDIPELMLL